MRVQGGVDKKFGVQILCKLYAVMFSSSFWLYPPLRSGHTLCIALRLSLRVSLLVNTEMIHKNSCLILRLKKKRRLFMSDMYILSYVC